MTTETQTPIDDLNPIAKNPISDEASSDDFKTSVAAAASDVEKKMRRAERFGISVQLSEKEKRNSRAERFGSGSGSTVVSDSSVSKGAEDLKRKTRAERFGSSNPVVASDDDAKKKARLARFAPTTKTNPQEDDKRKARALRFAEKTPLNTEEKANGNGNGNFKPVTQIKAIAEKSGGGD